MATPPAVDSSEVPTAGDPPAPLPVPATPLGGDALSGCGIITAPDTPPVPDDVSAEAWLIADLDTGDVIAARDPHGRHRPASIIKVLVAMQSLRELPVGKQVIGTNDDAAAEGTRVGVDLGGQYTVNDLLHGLLMHSGNDAAHALAVQLGGMDTAAAEDQRPGQEARRPRHPRRDPVGPRRTGHEHLGVRPRAVLPLRMAEPRVRRHRRHREVRLPRPSRRAIPAAQDSPGYQLENDNQLLYNYPGALGGKTGYTDDAGQTFVGAAEPRRPTAGRGDAARHPPADRAVGAGRPSARLRLRDTRRGPRWARWSIPTRR